MSADIIQLFLLIIKAFEHREKIKQKILTKINNNLRISFGNEDLSDDGYIYGFDRYITISNV
jgi:hypothetical protein